jgi:hypothetical protein
MHALRPTVTECGRTAYAAALQSRGVLHWRRYARDWHAHFGA